MESVSTFSANIWSQCLIFQPTYGVSVYFFSQHMESVSNCVSQHMESVSNFVSQHMESVSNFVSQHTESVSNFVSQHTESVSNFVRKHCIIQSLRSNRLAYQVMKTISKHQID